MRRAALCAAALCALLAAEPAVAEPDSDCAAKVTGATYGTPTDRYRHGALGDPWEWASLEVSFSRPRHCGPGHVRASVVLPVDLVFEDVAPKLADLDGDGEPEILTVESHRRLGARLAIYKHVAGQIRRVAATAHIGRTNRWLAQIGAADLDGDGRMEIAYIDRPHLAKILRVWRYEGGTLSLVAEAPGLSNHRFADPMITGGLRDCGTGPEIITADAEWRNVMASRLIKGRIESRALGHRPSPAGFAAALACR
ncbi:FG-GAP repeat domain-containing protein [Antarcticimicrobium sediminis]|uniref:VCBS repeat-containing protein n=1 Tax=Antarcticimicrobium sediminis TaxID=2546227 RepID=A0A4R5EZ69_9RHOB|nr:VCBS repeat-containing protein [Antarcticimicrobium sediminis]TDE40160.1 VCBS repeat-containing protein [Antarcticimicrobium sediminis]